MKTTTIGTLFLALTLFACTSETEEGSNGTNAQANTNAPSESGGSAPEYSVSCHGDVTKKGVGLGVGTLCVGGEPGTFCGDPCAAAEIEIRYEPPSARCGSTDVWAWDGSACKAYPTQNNGSMKCKGADCEKLYKSEEACKEAYASCIAK